MENLTARDKALRRLWGMAPGLALIGLVLLAVVLGVGIKAEGERIKAERMEALKKERPPVNVVVLETGPETIRDTLSLPAMVEAWTDLLVLAEVPGKVVELVAKEGDNVNKGDVIARIEPRDYENDLSQISAEYDNALRALGRAENLFKEEIVPKAELDEAVAREESLRASMKNAELRLERAAIRAPISGMVNRRDAKLGQYLNLMDPVAQILDIKRVKVNVGVPESDVPAVRGLSEFAVEFEALGGKKATGKKHHLSRSPESLAHLYKLQIEVSNPGGEILPGMFARVSIVKKEVPGGISVPLYAVISRNDQRYVVVEEDGVAHLRFVETGVLEGWRIEVTKGLKPGDRVVVVGQRSVDEGQALKVVRTVRNPEELFK